MPSICFSRLMLCDMPRSWETKSDTLPSRKALHLTRKVERIFSTTPAHFSQRWWPSNATNHNHHLPDVPINDSDPKVCCPYQGHVQPLPLWWQSTTKDWCLGCPSPNSSQQDCTGFKRSAINGQMRAAHHWGRSIIIGCAPGMMASFAWELVFCKLGSTKVLLEASTSQFKGVKKGLFAFCLNQDRWTNFISRVFFQFWMWQIDWDWQKRLSYHGIQCQKARNLHQLSFPFGIVTEGYPIQICKMDNKRWCGCLILPLFCCKFSKSQQYCLFVSQT